MAIVLCKVCGLCARVRGGGDVIGSRVDDGGLLLLALILAHYISVDGKERMVLFALLAWRAWRHRD